MTQRTSRVDDIVASVLKFQARAGLAIARDDVPAANRYLVKVWAAIDDLKAIVPEGRRELEILLEHRRPDIRLRAAHAVMMWATDLAIPVFGRLLVEDFGPEISANERSEIRISAALALYRYFGVRNYDQNRLIEPLKAFGIELPYYDHEKWQRVDIPTLPNRKKP